VNSLHLVLYNVSDRDGNQSLRTLWDGICQDCRTIEACGTQHLIMRRERSLLRVYLHLPAIQRLLEECEQIAAHEWRQERGQTRGTRVCEAPDPLTLSQRFLLDDPDAMESVHPHLCVPRKRLPAACTVERR
jgi:hypothetical protein